MHKFNSAVHKALIGILVVLCSLLSFGVNAETVNTGWLTNPDHPPVETRFVLTGQVNEQEKTVAGFLEVRLSGDWKTYWRSPGEGGIAPSMVWDQSINIEEIEWHWPHPKRFSLLGIETLGYIGSVIFPMTLHVSDWSKPVVFNSNLTMSSCTTVCVLTDYPFELSFIPSQLQVSEDAMHVYAQGLSQVPQASPLIENLEIFWDESKSKLQVIVDKKQGWHSPDMLIDGTSEPVQDSAFLNPKFSVDGKRLTATFDAKSWMGTPELAEQELIVTIEDNEFMAEQSAIAKAKPISQLSGEVSLAQMVLFALLGGLILNIMPCVLPVLGMKLSSVISAHGLEQRQIRFQFLASASGILFSFWMIAFALTILKLSGSAIGWGIQFQSGWFIGLMVLITALFGANMLGLFEIRLSSNANTWLAQKGSDSYRGHFVQGMFATLLATPCSAPFLGTAVAFALATNIVTMFAIFTALAIGMALPWILVAIFPTIALKLPKPGSWMNKVKLLFGVMMLITSVWLLTLLANHLPIFWIYVIGIVGFALAVLRTLRVYGEKAAAWFGGSVIVLVTAGMMIGSMTADKWATPLPQAPDWIPLSTQAIEQYVDDGKTVFVNVTADWCITCKANEIGVLLQEPVYGALTSSDVVPMEGDWTVPSEKVTSYLQSNGRFGVPFNMVYGPNAPQGIALPVILTEEAVMDALDKASGG